jgi:hypothetical protein
MAANEHADSCMGTEINSAPGWTAELSEVSAGVYRITLHDHTGQVRYSATGVDPEILKRNADGWLTTAITP